MEPSSVAHPHYDRLIAAARSLPPLRVAVVHPADDATVLVIETGHDFTYPSGMYGTASERLG